MVFARGTPSKESSISVIELSRGVFNADGVEKFPAKLPEVASRYAKALDLA